MLTNSFLLVICKLLLLKLIKCILKVLSDKFSIKKDISSFGLFKISLYIYYLKSYSLIENIDNKKVNLPIVVKEVITSEYKDVNKKTKKFGFIIKTWKRANVITNENDTLDLYNLINVNGKECDYEVFRSDTKLNIQELSFEKIMELKDKNSIQTVIKNVNEK